MRIVRQPVRSIVGSRSLSDQIPRLVRIIADREMKDGFRLSAISESTNNATEY